MQPLRATLHAFTVAILLTTAAAIAACTKTPAGERCAGAPGRPRVEWLGGCCSGECAEDYAKGWGKWCPDAEYGDAGKGEDPQLPVGVFEKHVALLNVCDVEALVELRTEDFKFFLPKGEIKRGKAGARELFSGACMTFEEGGFRGWKFTAEETMLVGNVYNVQWVLRAPFLEDYRGADAYVSRGDKMAAMVSTFDPSEIVFTRERPE